MNNIKTLNTNLTPIALVLLSCTAQANTNLDTVVVTGSSINSSISDIAATMWVIDQEQIETEINTGADLKVALGRLIPGLDFGGESRTNVSQNLRGRSALIMIDGVSLNSTRSISRQLESISPFNVARVEVLSGATSIYGAGASGGIINIITKKAQGETLVEVKAGASSGFNSSDDLTKDVALAISGGNDKVSGRLSASYQGSGAKYDANGEMILPDITQTDLQFNEIVDVMGNLEFTPNDNQSFSITAQYYNSQQDTEYSTYLGANLTGALGYTDDVGIQDGLELDDQPGTERLMVNLQYSHQNFLGHTLLAQAYYRNESMQFFPFPSFDPYNANGTYYLYTASQQDTDILGAKLLLNKNFNKFSLNYGIDAESESSTAQSAVYDIYTALASGGMVFNQTDSVQRYPDVDTQKLGAFAQGSLQLSDDWSVAGGLRLQYISHEIGDFTGISQQLTYGDSADAIEGGKTDYTEWLANLSTLYHLTDEQQVWAKFSQGFDLPDPSKYYGNGVYSGATLVNSINVEDNALEGVKTNALELGWRIEDNSYDAQVAAYYSLSDKTTSYDSSTFAIIVNDDQKRIYGVEAQFNYQFTDNWYAGVQGHYIKSETKSDGSWSNLAAEEASPSNSLVRGGYRSSGYGAELQLQTLFDYKDDDGEQLNGYSLANLSAFYALPIGRVNFGIQNLLNKEYETIWSQRAQIYYGGLLSTDVFTYAGQGRTFALSYQAEF